MRWLYHITETRSHGPEDARYSAPSLVTEGFLHASYRKDVVESGGLYFPTGSQLRVLQIDPRRLDVPVEIADTPRGPMPHVHGSIPADAIHATLALHEMERAPDRVTGTKIALVAFSGMTLLDLVGAHDPLSRIVSMGFDASASITLVSADVSRPWSLGGGAFVVDGVRPSLEPFDVVVIAGGPGTRVLEKDVEVINWIASFPHNRLLASVCTGSLLLGAAGRLDGKRATTHGSALDRLAEFGATAVRERVVDEGQVVTAGGVTCAIDLGLHLVRRLEGAEVAAAIAKQMEVT